jgi:hypothetical protein
VTTRGSSSTKDLLGQKMAAGSIVLAAGFGLATLARGGLLDTLVFVGVVMACWLAYVAHQSGSAAKSKFLYSGSFISIVFAVFVFARALLGLTPPAPDISISAERQSSCSTGYVFPGSAAELPAPVVQSDPNFGKDWSAWGAVNKAADADRTSVLLNVSSADHRTITLTKLSVVVTQRKAPKGVVVGYPCGGPTKARYIEYNLDAQPPRIIDSSLTVAYVGQPGLGLKTTPLTFPYTVTDENTASILVIGTVYSCDCLWHAELSWQAGAAHGVKEIDLDGQPFHTAGSNGLNGYYSLSGPWQSGGRSVKAMP